MTPNLARSGAHASARRPGERGSMLVMCLGIIVAMMLMATAFLATVMHRRDQNTGRDAAVYSQAAAETAEAVTRYLLDGRFAFKGADGSCPSAARPWTLDKGLDGRDATADDKVDDAKSFLQPLLYTAFDYPAKSKYASTFGAVDGDDVAVRSLWAYSTGRREGTGTVHVPFNSAWNWQHPLQPHGLALTPDILAEGGFPIGRFAKDMTPITGGTAWFEHRANVVFVDYAGCLPLGLDFGALTYATLDKATVSRRLAALLSAWADASINAEGRYNGLKSAAGATAALATAIVGQAVADPAATDMEARIPVASLDALRARMRAHAAASLSGFDTLRAAGALDELAPTRWAIPFTPKNANFYRMRDFADVSGSLQERYLQKAYSSASTSGPYFLLNANAAPLQTLAALHAHYHQEINAYTDADGKSAIYAAVYGTTASADATLPNPVKYDIIAAVNALTGANAGDARLTYALKAAVDAGSGLLTLDDVLEDLHDQFLARDPNAVNDIWARRLYRGTDGEADASVDVLATHRRLTLAHLPYPAMREDADYQLGYQSRPIRPDMTQPVETVSGTVVQGWADWVRTPEAGGTDTLPALVVRADCVITKVAEDTTVDPPIAAHDNYAVDIAFYWKGDGDAFVPPLPVGELLWGGRRHPHRFKPAFTETSSLDPAYVESEDEAKDQLDAIPFTIHARNFAVEFEMYVADRRTVTNAPYKKVVAGTPGGDEVAWAAEWPMVSAEMRALVESARDALRNFEWSVYRAFRDNPATQPLARLFVNRPGGPYRVMIRGALHDVAKGVTRATSDTEFVFQPRYSETEFPDATDAPDIGDAYDDFLPALGRVDYRRVLK